MQPILQGKCKKDCIPSRFLIPYLRYTLSVTFMAGPMLLLLTTSTSEYKVQAWFVEMSLENPIHEEELSVLEQIELQIELSRLPSSMRITLGTSVVCTLDISYFVRSRGINLSTSAPQFFRTKHAWNLMRHCWWTTLIWKYRVSHSWCPNFKC